MSRSWLQTASGLKPQFGVCFPAPILPDTFNSAASIYTAVTATGSASPNQFSTPGAWVEIEASLSANAGGVVITLNTGTALGSTNTSTLIQIGVGAAASEVVWATLSIGNASINDKRVIPGFIAAGSRVAVRVLSAAESSKSVVAAYMFIKDFGIGSPTSYGAITASATGVPINYSGSLNTMTGWTELVASTTDDIDIIGYSIQLSGDTGVSNGFLAFELGVGASSSEVSIGAPEVFTTDTNERVISKYGTVLVTPTRIPAGSRLVGRWQADTSATTTIDVTLVTAKG